MLLPGQLFYTESFAALCDRLDRENFDNEAKKTCELLLPYLSADEFVYSSPAQSLSGQSHLLHTWQVLLRFLDGLSDEVDAQSVYSRLIVVDALNRVVKRREFACDDVAIVQRFLRLLQETLGAANEAVAGSESDLEPFCMGTLAVAFVHFAGVQRVVVEALRAAAPLAGHDLREQFLVECRLQQKEGTARMPVSDVSLDISSALVTRVMTLDSLFYDFCAALVKYVHGHKSLPAVTRAAVGAVLQHMVVSVKMRPAQMISMDAGSAIAAACLSVPSTLGAAVSAMLLATSVHDAVAVDGALAQVESWIRAAPKLALDVAAFDYDTLWLAVATLFSSEHFLVLLRALRFAWAVIPSLPVPARTMFVVHFVCQTYFVKFLFHWNPIVRVSFHRLMLSRLLQTPSCTTSTYIKKHWGTIVNSVIDSMVASVPSDLVAAASAASPSGTIDVTSLLMLPHVMMHTHNAAVGEQRRHRVTIGSLLDPLESPTALQALQAQTQQQQQQHKQQQQQQQDQQRLSQPRPASSGDAVRGPENRSLSAPVAVRGDATPDAARARGSVPAGGAPAAATARPAAAATAADVAGDTSSDSIVLCTVYKPRTARDSDHYVTEFVAAVLRFAGLWCTNRRRATTRAFPAHMRHHEGYANMSPAHLVYSHTTLIELSAALKLLNEQAPTEIDMPVTALADAQ